MSKITNLPVKRLLVIAFTVIIVSIVALSFFVFSSFKNLKNNDINTKNSFHIQEAINGLKYTILKDKLIVSEMVKAETLDVSHDLTEAKLDNSKNRIQNLELFDKLINNESWGEQFKIEKKDLSLISLNIKSEYENKLNTNFNSIQNGVKSKIDILNGINTNPVLANNLTTLKNNLNQLKTDFDTFSQSIIDNITLANQNNQLLNSTINS